MYIKNIESLSAPRIRSLKISLDKLKESRDVISGHPHTHTSHLLRWKLKPTVNTPDNFIMLP